MADDRTVLLGLSERAMVAQANAKPLYVTRDEYAVLRRMDGHEWDDALRDAWKRAELPDVPRSPFNTGVIGDPFGLNVIVEDDPSVA